MSAKKIKFKRVRGAWQQPIMTGYKMVCCDCGLVHKINFRIAGVRVKRVQFTCSRMSGLTKAYRKQEGIRVR